jgi:hypothetical protein
VEKIPELNYEKVYKITGQEWENDVVEQIGKR